MEDPWLEFVYACAHVGLPTAETMVLDRAGSTVVIWVKSDGAVERRNVRLGEVFNTCVRSVLTSAELTLLGTDIQIVSSLQAEWQLSLCPAQGLLPTHTRKSQVAHSPRLIPTTQ